MPSGRDGMMRTRLRRYPALGFLAAAALLASLLPSALRVPLSGPSASAELAPVPGRSDSAQGDLSALGETSTVGLGGGTGLGGLGPDGRGPAGREQADLGPTGQPSPPGGGRNPSNKRCVGKPLRQTEDPLSPACVSYFKGDNGGATAKGVTGDEIVAVFLQSGRTCSAAPEFFDYDADPRADPVTVAYLRYFNERFQTYGRRVHAYGVIPPCNMPTESLLREIEERYRPFFVIGTTGADFALAAAGTGTITEAWGPKRSLTQRLAPFVLSYPPDHDDLVESAAEFLCARLAGRPARYALDPTLRIRQRKFGLLYYTGQDRENDGADWFLDRVRERCGEAAGEVVIGTVGYVGSSGYSEVLARMRVAGVTTVVSWWLEFGLTLTADANGWHPEWFLPDDLGVGDNFAGRLTWTGQASSAFGIMSGRRLGTPGEQHHRQAYAEGCACGDASTFPGAQLYHRLLLLFSGIQAAGPRLTPANLDKGLHALPARRSLDPFTPAAYFAPGNYSFVKDWSVVWWDPTGVPPGSTDVGCWRLVEDGLRYRAEDWQKRPGDDGIQGQGQPCQGDSS